MKLASAAVTKVAGSSTSSTAHSNKQQLSREHNIVSKRRLWSRARGRRQLEWSYTIKISADWFSSLKHSRERRHGFISLHVQTAARRERFSKARSDVKGLARTLVPLYTIIHLAVNSDSERHGVCLLTKC